MTRRRAAAAIAALAALLAAAPFLRRWRGNLLKAYHEPRPADPSPVEDAVTRTITAVAGELGGRPLTDVDVAELVRRFTLAQQVDAGWRAEFASLAALVDRWASAAGASSFVEAPAAVRLSVMDAVMAGPADGGRSRRLALVSADERARRLARADTIPFIAAVYRRSGVPWRARGYTRWVGVPGDAREYTRPGPEMPC